MFEIEDAMNGPRKCFNCHNNRPKGFQKIVLFLILCTFRITRFCPFFRKTVMVAKHVWCNNVQLWIGSSSNPAPPRNYLGHRSQSYRPPLISLQGRANNHTLSLLMIWDCFLLFPLGSYMVAVCFESISYAHIQMTFMHVPLPTTTKPFKTVAPMGLSQS